MRRIGKKFLKIVARGVVEGETGSAAELRVNVLQLPLELSDRLKNFLFRWREHAVEASEDRERQDNVLILTPFKRVPNQIRNTPDEADYLAMIQRSFLLSLRSCSSQYMTVS